MSFIDLNIRGIPVNELLPRCYELSKVFPTPMDLGMCVICIDSLLENPFWRHININKVHSNSAIPVVELLVFDNNFRSAISDLLTLWMTNGKVNWDFEDEPTCFPANCGSASPPRVPSTTSIRSTDSGYVPVCASASSSSASIASSSSSEASVTSTLAFSRVSKSINKAFDLAAFQLCMHSDEAIKPSESFSLQVPQNTSIIKNLNKHQAAEAISSSSACPNVSPDKCITHAKRFKAIDLTIPFSNSDPHSVDLLSPINNPGPLPNHPCGHDAVIKILNKQARVNKVDKIVDELFSVIDSTPFTKEALLKYIKEKLASIQKIASRLED